MTGTVGELLGRCLVALGADRVFGTGDSVVRGLPGLRHALVEDPALAVLLCDAAGRIGRGPGVALLPGGVLRLGSQPGAIADRSVVDDAGSLPAVLAGWSFGRVHAALEVELALDLDAPAPEGAEPIVLDPADGQMLSLSPSLVDAELVIVAGPGVLRGGASGAGFVDALRAVAEHAGAGVVNTWGAKGVFRWDSPFHLGTAGLQARDFELAGVPDAELVIVVGNDPAECPSQRWGAAQVLEVEPWQLASLVWRWEPQARRPERPRLYTELAAALQPLYASESVPLSPARATTGVAGARPDGGLVAADPGPAGLWVARTLPTTEPGSVVVPGLNVRGFAAAATLVAALDDRPAIAVVTDPPDPATLELLALADHWGASLTLEVWGADGRLRSAADHAERLAGSLTEPGVKVLPTPVDFAATRVLVEVAGEVVAWQA